LLRSGLCRRRCTWLAGRVLGCRVRRARGITFFLAFFLLRFGALVFLGEREPDKFVLSIIDAEIAPEHEITDLANSCRVMGNAFWLETLESPAAGFVFEDAKGFVF